MHKIFNRNNVKISYSCADNIEKIIKQHNNKIIEKHINKKTETEKSCNCNDKRTCPLDNNCLKSSIVYKATITTEEEPEDKKYYIGIAKTTFKTRFGNHKQSLNNEHYRNSTSLSRYFWDQKENNKTPKISWEILTKAPVCKNLKSNCPLCLNEKFQILTFKPKSNLLNSKDEIGVRCRHRRVFLLMNYVNR